MNDNLKRCWVVVAVMLPLLAAGAGCGARLSSSELGTVLNQIPKVPGADQPYRIPEPDPEPEAATTEQTSSEAASAEHSLNEQPTEPPDNEQPAHPSASENSSANGSDSKPAAGS